MLRNPKEGLGSETIYSQSNRISRRYFIGNGIMALTALYAGCATVPKRDIVDMCNDFICQDTRDDPANLARNLVHLLNEMQKIYDPSGRQITYEREKQIEDILERIYKSDNVAAVVSELSEMLDNEQPILTANAVNAIAIFGGESRAATQKLVYLLEKRSGSISISSGWHLSGMGDAAQYREVVTDTHPDYNWNRLSYIFHVRNALLVIGEPAVLELEKYMQEKRTKLEREKRRIFFTNEHYEQVLTELVEDTGQLIDEIKLLHDLVRNDKLYEKYIGDNRLEWHRARDWPHTKWATRSKPNISLRELVSLRRQLVYDEIDEQPSPFTPGSPLSPGPGNPLVAYKAHDEIMAPFRKYNVIHLISRCEILRVIKKVEEQLKSE